MAELDRVTEQILDQISGEFKQAQLSFVSSVGRISFVSPSAAIFPSSMTMIRSAI